MVVQGSEANADVVWLSAPETASCQKRADTMLRGTFPAGTHYFSVDAPTASKEGEYVFVVAPCAADDGRCASAP
jgi:hypothetical protein